VVLDIGTAPTRTAVEPSYKSHILHSSTTHNDRVAPSMPVWHRWVWFGTVWAKGHLKRSHPPKTLMNLWDNNNPVTNSQPGPLSGLAGPLSDLGHSLTYTSPAEGRQGAHTHPWWRLLAAVCPGNRPQGSADVLRYCAVKVSL